MNKTLNSLTATRAIAAILVVIFHYGNIDTGISFIDTFFKRGYLSVSYFFVLSGFIMYLSYADNYKGYKSFIQRRIARIIPLYWVALIMSTLVIIYLIIKGHPLPFNFGLALLSNASFTQAYFSKYIFSINTPGWSLCVEMLFYLSFPFLLQFQKSRNKLFIYATIILNLISTIIHNLLLNGNTSLVVFANYSPFLHLNQFLIGMLAAQFYKVKNSKINTFISLSSLSIIVLFMGIHLGISAHDGLLAPFFALLIGSIAVSDPKFLKARPLVFLGEISYGIYILQQPVHDYFHGMYSKYSTNQNAEFIIYIILLLAISAFFYYTIEIPCRRWINNFGKKGKTTINLQTVTLNES